MNGSQYVPSDTLTQLCLSSMISSVLYTSTANHGKALVISQVAHTATLWNAIVLAPRVSSRPPDTGDSGSQLQAEYGIYSTSPTLF